MKWLMLMKRVFEAVLFIFCHFLIGLAVSEQLNWVNSVLILLGVLVFISYIILDETIRKNE